MSWSVNRSGIWKKHFYYIWVDFLRRKLTFFKTTIKIFKIIKYNIFCTNGFFLQTLFWNIEIVNSIRHACRTNILRRKWYHTEVWQAAQEAKLLFFFYLTSLLINTVVFIKTWAEANVNVINVITNLWKWVGSREENKKFYNVNFPKYGTPL